MTMGSTTAANSYQAQLQIRRDAEERSVAQKELGSWFDQTKSSTPAIKKNKSPASSNSITVSPFANHKDERQRGNVLFSQGKYEDAVQCYTKCLSEEDAAEDCKALVFSNRAQSYLRMKNYPQAEADATSALQIDPLHFKSYQRRCVARLAMGKVRAAMVDVCQMNDVKTNDGEAAQQEVEIEKLKTKCKKALVDAAKRAPRRKIPVTVVASS